MNTKRLSIGEMSRINHTSINALRLYDKLGILRPAYVDPNTNYRYYDINQNSRLNMINYMKELGMSLQDIKDTLDQENMTLIEAILLKKQQKNLEEMHSNINDIYAGIWNSNDEPIYFVSSNKEGDVYYVLKPEFNLLMAKRKYIGCLSLEVIEASLMENALECIEPVKKQEVENNNKKEKSLYLGSEVNSEK